jgi:hypothetical protein
MDGASPLVGAGLKPALPRCVGRCKPPLASVKFYLVAADGDIVGPKEVLPQ